MKVIVEVLFYFIFKESGGFELWNELWFWGGGLENMTGGENKGRNKRQNKKRTGCRVKRGSGRGNTETFHGREKPNVFLDH